MILFAVFFKKCHWCEVVNRQKDNWYFEGKNETMRLFRRKNLC